MNILTRKEVYDIIDKEREYQEIKWGFSETRGEHSITEFIAYTEDYLNEIKHIIARERMAIAYPKAQKILPKVAALIVNCMEQNGASER